MDYTETLTDEEMAQFFHAAEEMVERDIKTKIQSLHIGWGRVGTPKKDNPDEFVLIKSYCLYVNLEEPPKEGTKIPSKVKLPNGKSLSISFCISHLMPTGLLSGDPDYGKDD